MAEIPGGAFDGSKYQKDTVVPPGQYVAQMTYSKFKRNKADTGDLLQYSFDIISGEFKGVDIFGLLNYTHPKQTAEKMGRRDLESMRIAAGLPATGFKDTGALHGIPMIVTVGIQPAKDQWPEKNVITAWEPYDQAKGEKLATQVSAKASTASSPAAKASKKPDWMNKKKEEPPAEKEEAFDSPADEHEHRDACDDIPL